MRGGSRSAQKKARKTKREGKRRTCFVERGDELGVGLVQQVEEGGEAEFQRGEEWVGWRCELLSAPHHREGWK